MAVVPRHRATALTFGPSYRLQMGRVTPMTLTFEGRPGVRRGPGFKNREDYFDSIELVLQHLGRLQLQRSRMKREQSQSDGVPLAPLGASYERINN